MIQFYFIYSLSYKQRILIAILLICQINSLFGQNVSINKILQFGSNRDDIPMSMDIDTYGNIFQVGVFMDTVDFDPGPSVNSLISYGRTDIYIKKLDSNCNYLWAKRIGKGNQDEARDIAVTSKGSVHITGLFEGRIDFDPSQNTYNLRSSSTFNDQFILKLNNNGDFEWAKSIGSKWTDLGGPLMVDDQGNVFYIFHLVDTIDADVGPGVFNVIPSGTTDFCVSKLDSNGNFIWAKQFGGNSTTIATEIQFDKTGNILVSGYYSGTVDFNPGIAVNSISSNGLTDGFLLKLNQNGDLIWVTSIGSADSEIASTFAVDDTNNILIAGFFDGSISFNSKDTLHSYGLRDIYLAKLNANGAKRWIKHSVKSNNSKTISSMIIDKSDQIFITGTYRGDAIFKPLLNTDTLISLGSEDIFLQKIGSNSLIEWTESIGGKEREGSSLLEQFKKDEIILSGYFSDTVFLPNDTLFSNNRRNIFYTFLSESFTTNSTEEETDIVKINCFPIPSDGMVHLNISKQQEKVHIRIYDIHGKIAVEKFHKLLLSTDFKLPEQKGIYFLNIHSLELNQTIKLIKN